ALPDRSRAGDIPALLQRGTRLVPTVELDEDTAEGLERVLQLLALGARRIDGLVQGIARGCVVAFLFERQTQTVLADAEEGLRGASAAKRVEGLVGVAPLQIRPAQVSPRLLGRAIENIAGERLENGDGLIAFAFVDEDHAKRIFGIAHVRIQLES